MARRHERRFRHRREGEGQGLGVEGVSQDRLDRVVAVLASRVGARAGGFHAGRAVALGETQDALSAAEAIEGPIHLTDCAPDPENCSLAHDCPASTVWLEAQRRMTDVLRQTTLEALLAAPRRNRRVIYTIGEGRSG